VRLIAGEHGIAGVDRERHVGVDEVVQLVLAEKRSNFLCRSGDPKDLRFYRDAHPTP